MARLPVVGSDTGTWGTVLNDYLQSGIVNDGALSWRLEGSHSVGATTLTLKTQPKAVGANLGFVIIDPYTTEAEIRKVTAVGATSFTVAAMTYAHADGDVVFWYVGGLVPWTWWGGKGTGSTADATNNVTAFNRLTNQLYNVGATSSGGIYIPQGTWYVDSELRPERDQIVQGAGVMTSKIIAHSTFSFPNTETAIIHPYRDGAPVTFETAGPSSRWGMRDIYIDGATVTGSNGIVSSPQQPDVWLNVRVDNCLGYGIGLADVQQHVMKNIELIGNGVALRYRSCEFVYVEDLNIEQSITGDFKAEQIVGGLNCHNNHFVGVHLESNPGIGAGEINFDMQDGDGWMFKNVWNSNADAAATLFKFSWTGGHTGFQIFTLENIRCNQPSASYKVVDDTTRSISRTVNDVNRIIQLLVSGVSDVAASWALEITGKPGGAGSDPPKFASGIRLSGNLYGGSGVPAAGLGANGDYYFRTDTPGTANQRLYVKSAGAWTGVV